MNKKLSIVLRIFILLSILSIIIFFISHIVTQVETMKIMESTFDEFYILINRSIIIIVTYSLIILILTAYFVLLCVNKFQTLSKKLALPCLVLCLEIYQLGFFAIYLTNYLNSTSGSLFLPLTTIISLVVTAITYITWIILKKRKQKETSSSNPSSPN